MTIKEFRKLTAHATRRTAPENFSVDSVDAAFAEGLKELAGTYNTFMKNRYDIYDIIAENADIIVPNKVMDAMGAFAEIIQVGNGDKKVFKRGGLGRNRAKKFLTQAAMNGLYETFRLDNETFTVDTKTIGGAVEVDFQRMIDGAESLLEYYDVLVEAQVDAIYGEVQKALMAAAASMPAANKVIGSYSASDLQAVLNTVKAYGGAATIFASPEFIAAMGPDAIVPAIAGAAQGIYHPDDIDAIHNLGRIRIFRGAPIVELRQSFLDETNTQVMIHPQYAYILPAGKEKVVKVVLEGATQLTDFQRPDGSLEINVYKNIGVGILAFNNWGVYQNTGINADNWYDSSMGL